MNRKRASQFLLFVFPACVAFADSTVNTNPALAINIKNPNTACANVNEVAVSSAGKPLKCRDGVWRYQGMTGIQQFGRTERIFASDVGSYKVMRQDCPASQRPVGGGCVIYAGSGAENRAQALIMHSVTTDFRGWLCTWGPLNSRATEPWFRNGVLAPAEATVGVYCADY